MNRRDPPRQRTRRAILDAVAEVIVESNDLGFSVQEVADRAGLTHRTVYNHFPIREALCEGFAVHVGELLSTLGPPPDAKLSLETFTSDGVNRKAEFFGGLLDRARTLQTSFGNGFP